jgi:hypothetical protein
VRLFSVRPTLQKLGARALKKVKAARRSYRRVMEKALKTAPKRRRFCHLFTGT